MSRIRRINSAFFVQLSYLLYVFGFVALNHKQKDISFTPNDLFQWQSVSMRNMYTHQKNGYLLLIYKNEGFDF